MDLNTDNDRSYVREDIYIDVNYRVISRAEYDSSPVAESGSGSQVFRNLTGEISEQENEANVKSRDAIVGFLLHIDKKLDKILSLLTQDREDQGETHKGVVINISGSGMKFLTEKPVDCGEIIHASFVLSENPFVFLELYGEVVNITHAKENRKTGYYLGVNFLNLSSKDRQQIITSVFQRQREALRQRKSASPE